ncbi:hypothetical protein FQR65_LT09823 [Abscondita terminalis]|nr:hypothetical protein FQR65_LT09823 [Abscondita terminalis]
MSINDILLLALAVTYGSLITAYSNEKLDLIITSAIKQIFNENDTLAFIYDSFVEVEIPKVVNNQYAIARCSNHTSLKLDKPNSFIIHLSNQDTLNDTTNFLYDSSFFESAFSIRGNYLIIINEMNVTNLNNIFEIFWLKNIQRVVVLTFNDESEIPAKVHTSDPIHEGSDCGKISKIVHTRVYHQNLSIKHTNEYRNLYRCAIWMSTFMDLDHPLLQCYDDLFRQLAKTINGYHISLIKPNPGLDVYDLKLITSMVHLDNGAVASKVNNEIVSFGYTDSPCFVVRAGEEVPSVKLLLNVFSMQVWIYVAGAYVITSVALWFITSINKRQFQLSQLAKYLLDVFSATLWGSFSFEPKKAKVRCIFICYLLYHIHIQSGFTCNLVTILTTPQFQRGISTLEKLSLSNIKIYDTKGIYLSWSDDVTDSVNSRIKGKLEIPSDSDMISYEKLIENFMTENCAIVLTELEIKYLRQKSYGLSNVRINIINTDTIVPYSSQYSKFARWSIAACIVLTRILLKNTVALVLDEILVSKDDAFYILNKSLLSRFYN